MPTAEQAYQDIVRAIEENRLESAIASLLSYAEQYSADKVTAVRMRRSEWKTLEEEALMMGDTSSIRERRSSLKLQLFRLADAIRKDAAEKRYSPDAVGGSGFGALPPPYSGPRGEGPLKVFLAYAPDPADRQGAEELAKSMALLLHLKRIEVFDQQKSPAGKREAALNQALEEAEVILLLLSNNFLADVECLGLQQDAYGLYQQNRAAVVPILYNPCEWKELDIGRLQALPRNGQFITQWANDDEAYAKISREIGELAKGVRERLAPSVLRTPPPRGEGEAPSVLPPSQQLRGTSRTPSRHETGTGAPRGEGDAKPYAAEKPKPAYDTAELRNIFRQGDTGSLIQQLITLTNGDGERHDQSLLLEQRWREVSEDEKNNTASLESITVRKNKLNQDLLKLIREMEG